MINEKYNVLLHHFFDQLSSTGTNLQVREDLKKGVYIEGLQEEVIASSAEALHLL
jgi:hypothetical protein